MDIHGITAQDRPDGSLFVSMAQPAEPVIGLLLDARSERHLVAAQGLSNCPSSRASDLQQNGGGALSWICGLALLLLQGLRNFGPVTPRSFSAAGAALFALALSAPATADVCTPPTPTELCGGRIFAEPLNSIGGLTHREMVLGMQALATEYPEWVRFEEFGQGSADGLPLYAVEVTAPDSPIPYAERKIVLVNQSVHGNEPGGREGAARYTEDLVTGLDPERTALLDRVRLIQTFINPDGWTAGDHDHIQTGGGAYFWARQNGAGPVSGVGDFGLGVDLNRQAPWFGISHSSGPVSQPESIAFVEYVRKLASEGDIQAAVDIHGEVTDAAAWVMLSSGQFNLDEALNQRYQGEAVRSAIIESLADSAVSDLINTITGGVEPMVLTASSEFGSIASESTSSGTGFLGDWISQTEGGGAASLSTIELYNFLVSPGVNSLTARPEVMQYYRDTVRGILAGLIEQAAVEHDTRMVGGSLVWVDDFPRVEDPVRPGVVVSAADFFRDLAPWYEGGLRATDRTSLGTALAAFPDSVSIHTAGLAGDMPTLASLRSYVEAGGNLVLTDAGLNLLPALLPELPADSVSQRLDNGGKVSYDRSHPLAAGIRDISWMNTETATIGLRVEGSGANVPAWRVDSAAWGAIGGTTAGVSGDQTSVGELQLGSGTIRIVGVLLPNPDNSSPDIGFGLNSYGVLDTGYIVFANAVNAQLKHEIAPAVAGTNLPARREPSPASRDLLSSTRGGALPGAFLLVMILLGPALRRGPALGVRG